MTTSPGDPEEALHPHIPKSTDACVFNGHSRCDLHVLNQSRIGTAEPGCGSVGSIDTIKSDHPCLPHAPYDLINFQQTLEHLYDPLLSLMRLRQILAPGGWLHTSVPHYNMPHMVPNHFSGVSPCGLFALFKSAGLDVKGIGWWGNHSYAYGLTIRHSWYDWRDVGGMATEKDILPLGDDLAMQTWILARQADHAAFSEPFDFASRPLIDSKSIDDAFRHLDKNLSTPSGKTALNLLLKNIKWLDEEADRLVVAAAIADFFPQVTTNRSIGCHSDDPLNILAFGTIINLAFGALGRSFPVTPWNGNSHYKCISGALISDLWASRYDPFQMLNQVASTLAHGAPLFITCQVAGDVRISTPSLGLCTRQGLVVTLLRAGFKIDFFGSWGTDEYAFKSLQGRAPSARVHFSVSEDLESALENRDIKNLLDIRNETHFQSVMNQKGNIESTIWALASKFG